MTENNDKVFLGEASFSQKEGSVGSNPTPRIIYGKGLGGLSGVMLVVLEA